VLDEDEKELLSKAATLLAKLGDTFEVAGRDAAKYEAQLKQERAAEKERELDAIASRFVGDADTTGMVEILRDVRQLVLTDEREAATLLSGGAFDPRTEPGDR